MSKNSDLLRDCRLFFESWVRNGDCYFSDRNHLLDRIRALESAPEAAPDAPVEPRAAPVAWMFTNSEGDDDFGNNHQALKDCEYKGGPIVPLYAAPPQAQQAREGTLEETTDSVGDWQCKDFADGWITFPDRKAAERYQEQTGAMMRYRRFYPAKKQAAPSESAPVHPCAIECQRHVHKGYPRCIDANQCDYDCGDQL